MTKHRLPRSLKELLNQGKEDGFLVQDDILLVYTEPEKHIEEIDNFFNEAFGNFSNITNNEKIDSILIFLNLIN